MQGRSSRGFITWGSNGRGAVMTNGKATPAGQVWLQTKRDARKYLSLPVCDVKRRGGIGRPKKISQRYLSKVLVRGSTSSVAEAAAVGKPGSEWRASSDLDARAAVASSRVGAPLSRDRSLRRRPWSLLSVQLSASPTARS